MSELKVPADGYEDDIIVISDDEILRFNDRVDEKILDGWRLVQPIVITPLRKGVQYGGDKLSYTAVFGRTRQ